MSAQFQLNAKTRHDLGKGASRRLRRTGMVPGVIYGLNRAPMSIAVDKNELGMALLNRAFYTAIINIERDGQIEQAVLRDLQRHPAKPTVILHLDLLRIEASHIVRVHVPFRFINEDSSVGIKTEGGQVSHHLVESEVECLPADIPELIEVDLKDLHVGQGLHLSNIPLPAGVKFTALDASADHDHVVVSIYGKVSTGGDADEAAAA